MGIFNIWKIFSSIFQKNPTNNQNNPNLPSSNSPSDKQEFYENKSSERPKDADNQIPEGVFLEKREPYEFMKETLNVGMEEIFAFLKQDFESVGYDDALNIPDKTFEIQGIDVIKKRFMILLEKAFLHYSEYLNHLDYYIETRKEIGLLDLVARLLKEKENVTKRIEKINNEKQLCIKNEGYILSAISAYQKGFRKGLSVITLAETGKYMKENYEILKQISKEQ